MRSDGKESNSVHDHPVLMANLDDDVTKSEDPFDSVQLQSGEDVVEQHQESGDDDVTSQRRQQSFELRRGHRLLQLKAHLKR